MADTDAVVAFEDVEVLDDSGGILECRHHGRPLWVNVNQLAPGTTVRRKGDRGRLVIPRWLADTLAWNHPSPPLPAPERERKS